MDNKALDWYEKIEKMVIEYQNGDNDVGLELINAFEPYMRKYIKIIKEGFIDLRDKDSRKFLSLFISDQQVRRLLKRAHMSKETRNAAYSATNLLCKVCEPISPDDLRQDFYLILLILCKRYRKRGKKTNFCGYLYNAFRYEAHRRIMELIKDPLIFRSDLNMSFNEGEYINYKDEIFQERNFIEETPMIILEDDLDNSWVRGLTCDDIFSDLTTLQRIILKMHYIDGFSDYKVGDKLGVHRDTIRRNRQKAEEHIAERLGEEYMEALRIKRSIKDTSNQTRDNNEDYIM